MPNFFGKLFGLNNKSSTLSTSTRYTYPSNPPLLASGSTLPAAAPGFRESSLPPYPHNEFPFGPFRGGPHSNGSGTPNDVDENENPFSDANRASISAIRRSKSYAFSSTDKNQSGSLLHDLFDKNAGEDNEDSSGQVPTRRRALSTTTRPDPSQFFLTRPLKSKTKPPPSPVRTREKCTHCDGVRATSEPRKENKGKVGVSASPSRFVAQDTNEDADCEDNSEGDIDDSISEEEGEVVITKNDVVVVPDDVTKTMKQPKRESNDEVESQSYDAVAPVVKTPDIEDFNKRYPPIHSDEEIAKALQFYEEFGPVSNGAQGPNTTRPDKDFTRPEHFPETAKKVKADAYAMSSVSPASTKAVPPNNSVPEASAASSSSNASSFTIQATSIGTHAPSESTATPATVNVKSRREARSSTGTSATVKSEPQHETSYPTRAEFFGLPFEPIPPEGHFLIGAEESKDYWYLRFEDANGKRRGKLVRKCLLGF